MHSRRSPSLIAEKADVDQLSRSSSQGGGGLLAPSGRRARQPSRPPAAFVSLRRPTQSGRRDRNIVVGPVAALPAWRINDARNVTTRREHVALFAATSC